MGKPTHTLVPCWMPKPLPPRNQCTGWCLNLSRGTLGLGFAILVAKFTHTFTCHFQFVVSMHMTHHLNMFPFPFWYGEEWLLSPSCCSLYINSNHAINALQLIPKMNIVGYSENESTKPTKLFYFYFLLSPSSMMDEIS